MEHLYAPFTGDKLAAVEINGHRVVILTSDRDELLENLDLVGAESVQEIFEGELEERSFVDVETNFEAEGAELDLGEADDDFEASQYDGTNYAVRNFDVQSAEQQAIQRVAIEARAAVVISPPEISIPNLLEGLRQNLPWPQ